MLVFHYVAHTLKDVPLFDMTMDDDSEVSDEEDSLAVNDSGNGAIYNDFDIDPQTALFQEDAEEFSYSQTTNVKPSNTTAANASIQEAVDHAVMAEDRSVGVNYEHLSWETELFDNVSDSCDEAYCEKVYKLVTNEEGCWDKLAVSDEAMCMFQRRNRTKWDLPDTVYDAWMILNGLEREFFDYHLFFALLYPDLVDIAIDKVAKNQEVVPEDPIPSYQRPKSPSWSSSEDESEPEKIASNVKRARFSATSSSSDSSSASSNSSDSSDSSDSGTKESRIADSAPTRKRTHKHKLRRILSDSDLTSVVPEKPILFKTPLLNSTPTKESKETN